MIFRSLLYGYLGAVGAGLAVGALGAVTGAATETVAAAAAPLGMAAGLIGMSVLWVRPTLARIRTRHRR